MTKRMNYASYSLCPESATSGSSTTLIPGAEFTDQERTKKTHDAMLRMSLTAPRALVEHLELHAAEVIEVRFVVCFCHVLKN